MSFRNSGQLRESDVLDVVMGGDTIEIRKWVDEDLPVAGPMDNISENSTSILTPAVEEIIYGVIRKLPAATREIFLEALERRGVRIRCGNTDELWDHIIKGNLLGIRHWVRSLPLEDTKVDNRGRLIIAPTSLLPENFCKKLMMLVERATPAVREFALNELAKRGVFVPAECARRKPVSDKELLDLSASSGIFGLPRARTDPEEDEKMKEMADQLEDEESDSDDDFGGSGSGSDDDTGGFSGPTMLDFTALVLRLAKNGMLYRPRPLSPQYAFFDGFLPVGRFSPMHQFVVNYLSLFKLKGALEAYAAWYELRLVAHDLFSTKREELFAPSQELTVEYFLHNMSLAALGAGVSSRQDSYDPQEYNQRGVFEHVTKSVFYDSEIEFEYMTSLMSRVDSDSKPTYKRVKKKLSECAELLLALSRTPLPQPQFDYGWAVAENIPSGQSDSSLFAYIFQQFKFNCPPFFEKSPWAKRLAEVLSAEEIAMRQKEQAAQSAIRDWLQHRAPVSAFHNTITVIKPEHNRIWDALIKMCIRTALANYFPKRLPKYKMHPDDDEFGVLAKYRKSKNKKKADVEDVPTEMINTCFTYLDMITWQDTNDVSTLALYLEAADCFSFYNPTIFGSKNLMGALDQAYISGTPLARELRNPMNFQRPQPMLVSVKQLPPPLRRVFTALGVVYSRDAADLAEKKGVLRILVAFFILYNVQFTKKLAATIKKVEGGVTFGLVRWMLALADVMKVPPEGIMMQLTHSNGLFDGRHEVLEHISLLAGAYSGLLPAFRYADDASSPVFDKTTQFLYHMPANSPLPPPRVVQGDWLGNSFLRQALYSTQGTTEFDSLLPALAVHYHAKKQDALAVLLTTHEAQVLGTNKETDIQPTVRKHADHRFKREELEDVVLRITKAHMYLVLSHGLELFYPSCALRKVVFALLEFSRGKYREAKKHLADLAKLQKALPSELPKEYHMYHDDPDWTSWMIEAMLRKAVGVESAFPALSPYDAQFLQDTFDEVGLEEGKTVMEEVSAQHGKAAVPEPKQPLNSDQMYDLKMEEFKDFVSEDMILWEYQSERMLFYEETLEWFLDNSASPVVIGAFFYSIWWHFTYGEERTPLEEFTPEEEVRTLFTTTHYWHQCNEEVYGRVVGTLEARMYCVLLGNQLGGMEVEIADVKDRLRLVKYFPRRKRKVAVQINDSTSSTSTSTSTARTIMIEVHPNGIESIEALKQQIAKREEVDAARFRLFKGFLYLSPNSLVKDCSLLDDDDDLAVLRLEFLDPDAPDDVFKKRDIDEEKVHSDDEDDDEKKFESKHDNGPTPNGNGSDSDEDDLDRAERKRREQQVLSERMNLDGFLVYNPLEKHHYMPEAGDWEAKWQLEERKERIAFQSGKSPEQVEDELAEDFEGYGEFRDVRRVDVPLFKQVLAELLFQAKYQQAYYLANDVMDFFPKIWEQHEDLMSLRDHLDRVRVVFWVTGIEELKTEDLNLSKLPQLSGATSTLDSSDESKVMVDIPLAANLANVSWLPVDFTKNATFLQRTRLAWNAKTKLSVIKHLFVHHFPKISLADVKKRMDDGSVQARISLLKKIAQEDPRTEDPRLEHVCDLMINALLVEDAEDKNITVAQAAAKLVSAANAGTLYVLMRLAERTYLSIMDLVELSPVQVIYTVMNKMQDMELLKEYLRVVEPASNSKQVVQHLVDAFVFYVERMVDMPRDDSDMDNLLKGTAPELNPLTRNRFLAFVSNGNERRVMHTLGEAFIQASNRVDMHDARLRARLMDNLKPLFTLKFECLYAAYFSFFVGAHAEGMKRTLGIIDKGLLGLKPMPKQFKEFLQRALFLTGEYRSLKLSVAHAVETEPDAAARVQAKKKTEALIRQKKEELKRVKEERKAKLGDLYDPAVDDEKEDEEEDDNLPDDVEEVNLDLLDDRDDDPEVSDKKRFTVALAWAKQKKEDLEVELISKRYSLVMALLNALQSLNGYDLFTELEGIASGFKSLAWRYQDVEWFRQAVDCHRINELINIEMEYIPVKLRRFNWINPDEIEFQQLWSYYATTLPKGMKAKPVDELEPDDHDRRPDHLSMGQFEKMIADSYLSGVQPRFLEHIRKEYAVTARRMEKLGKHPGRVFNFVHQVKDRLIAHYKKEFAEDSEYFTRDEVHDIINESAHLANKPSAVQEEEKKMKEHLRKVRGQRGDQEYPNTLLFIVRDRFGKWDLGVDASNSFEAEHTLRVLSRLHKAAQAQLFKDYYYS